MDTAGLREILAKTTCQLRKGASVERSLHGNLEVTEVFAMPHVSDAPAGVEIVDLELIAVGVDREAAEAQREGLVRILDAYPQPDRLRDGPSFIEVGAEVGQSAALCLFALGKVLGLWDVITPARFGLAGAEARAAAGAGYVMITGYPRRNG